ncbi:DUF397 domain-containing protein [Actinomadura macrotermitis]|uniref:DUF397 domain-containing protein n=1 Tax=Actinomadura macrotermitis TaxID=2585200 RepID=A0A7K0BQQ3_9ACTN|nr:hypothetical protein [Actinomadura macrotermitis]
MITQWRKSSHSQGGAQGECVELSTNIVDTTLIQDSKNPGSHLSLDRSGLAALLQEIKAGMLDL